MSSNHTEELQQKDLVVTVVSMMFGVGILSLPRVIAEVTQPGDGLISISLAGLISIVLAWTLARLASRFPKQNFSEYTPLIIPRPFSFVANILLGVSFFIVAAFLMRVLAIITKLYLFDRTPIEVITLVFLLVIIYAVSGSRFALLRLNMMFLPIVMFVLVLVQIMNLGFFEFNNLKPVFATPWQGILKGIVSSTHGFLGFEVILFYTALMKNPQKAPKAAVIGISLSLLMYLIIYIFAIGVFSRQGMINVVFPTIEMAKEVEVPGEFFERFESILLTIWVMTVFNSVSMAFDISVVTLNSMFKKIKRFPLILTLSPILYMLSMMPQDLEQVTILGEWIGLFAVITGIIIPILLLWIAKIRGVKGHA